MDIEYSLPPSELIALKNYYDNKWKGASGHRSQEQVDAKLISDKLEIKIKDYINKIEKYDLSAKIDFY